MIKDDDDKEYKTKTDFGDENRLITNSFILAIHLTTLISLFFVLLFG